MSQGPLSRRVRYLKREEGGLNEMCEYSQRIYNGGKEEGRREKEKEITDKVLSLKEQGFDEEMIKKVLKTITEEEMVLA